MEIVVLRLGHRLERDKRVTTHIGLVSRALGAQGLLLAAEDKCVERSITRVAKRWGGEFFVKTGVRWREELRRWHQAGGKVCHLTMYGANLHEVIDEIQKAAEDERTPILVVVGAEKVPFEVYETADWNVAIGNQPHSEIAALAIFLDHLQRGQELTARFEHAELEIVPSRRGKEVVVKEEE
jgi:tRNA (cytidine56-2'-O)-methyltransferase